MSNYDIAKKDAARLLKIAKENLSGDMPTIPIKNLSQAKEYIAKIKGYKTWFEYERELKTQDAQYINFHKNEKLAEIKRVLENIDDLTKQTPFKFIPSDRIVDEFKYFEKKERQSYVIAKEIQDKTFFSSPEKPWNISQYPLYISGSTGSGSDESIFSLLNNYVNNQEGAIILNGDGGHSSFWKLYSSVTHAKRNDDFYILNFMSRDESASNTIDPINDIIGDEALFMILFGQKMGALINSLCECIKNADGLVSFDNLESFLNLDNLKLFLTDDLFKSAWLQIESYLAELVDFDERRAIKKHVINCMQARKTVDVILNHPFVFSIQPQVKMDKVFYQRKLLNIMFPSLEKSPDYCSNLVALIVGNIEHVARKFKGVQNIQNIIYKEIDYSTSHQLVDYIFKETNHEAINYIYKFYGHWDRSLIIPKCVNESKTFVLMKEYAEYPDALKIKIFDHMVDKKGIFNKKSLKDLDCGEAFIFSTLHRPVRKVKMTYTKIESVHSSQLNRKKM